MVYDAGGVYAKPVRLRLGLRLDTCSLAPYLRLINWKRIPASDKVSMRQISDKVSMRQTSDTDTE